MADPVVPPPAGDPAPTSQSTASEAATEERPSLFSRITDIVLWLAIAAALSLAILPRDSGPNVGQPASTHVLPLVGESGTFKLPGNLERPLLIEAFASWCGACKRSNGTLEGLVPAQEAGLLDVVAVSVDDNAQQALAAKKSWPITVDVLHDKGGEFSKNYRVEVLPTYILIGKDGRVQRVTAGVAGASDIRAWLKAGEQ